jgi:hypothetical protein
MPLKEAAVGVLFAAKNNDGPETSYEKAAIPRCGTAAVHGRQTSGNVNAPSAPKPVPGR